MSNRILAKQTLNAFRDFLGVAAAICLRAAEYKGRLAPEVVGLVRELQDLLSRHGWTLGEEEARCVLVLERYRVRRAYEEGIHTLAKLEGEERAREMRECRVVMEALRTSPEVEECIQALYADSPRSFTGELWAVAESICPEEELQEANLYLENRVSGVIASLDLSESMSAGEIIAGLKAGMLNEDFMRRLWRVCEGDVQSGNSFRGKDGSETRTTAAQSLNRALVRLTRHLLKNSESVDAAAAVNMTGFGHFLRQTEGGVTRLTEMDLMLSVLLSHAQIVNLFTAGLQGTAKQRLYCNYTHIGCAQGGSSQQTFRPLELEQLLELLREYMMWHGTSNYDVIRRSGLLHHMSRFAVHCSLGGDLGRTLRVESETLPSIRGEVVEIDVMSGARRSVSCYFALKEEAARELQARGEIYMSVNGVVGLRREGGLPLSMFQLVLVVTDGSKECHVAWPFQELPVSLKAGAATLREMHVLASRAREMVSMGHTLQSSVEQVMARVGTDYPAGFPEMVAYCVEYPLSIDGTLLQSVEGMTQRHQATERKGLVVASSVAVATASLLRMELQDHAPHTQGADHEDLAAQAELVRRAAMMSRGSEYIG